LYPGWLQKNQPQRQLNYANEETRHSK